MTLEEVAKLLGIQPESARKLLRRHGVDRHNGYWQSEVEAVRITQGRRTDLEKD